MFYRKNKNERLPATSNQQPATSNQQPATSFRLTLLALALCVFSSNIAYAKKPVKKLKTKSPAALSSNKLNQKAPVLSNTLTQAPINSYQNLGDPNKNHGISAIAYSPDGATLASVDNDGLLKLWNTATGSVQATTESETYGGGGLPCVVKNLNDACDQSKKYENLWPIYAVAFSADGKTIVTTSGGANGVKTWDVKNGDATTLTAIHTFSNQGAAVQAVAFSPNSKVIATGTNTENAGYYRDPYLNNNIMLRDAITGGDLLTIQTGLGGVKSLAFSPDGASLVSATDDQNITLWDANTGNKIRNFDIHNYAKDQEFASAVAFSPDGLLLATGGFNKEPYGGVLKLWHVSDATIVKTIQEGQQINAVAFSHDGKKLATANFDGKVRLYDVASGKKLAEISANKRDASTVAFSPDDKTLASSNEGSRLEEEVFIKFWKVQ